MEINEFFLQLKEDAEVEAAINEITVEEALTESFLEYIKEADETDCPEVIIADSALEESRPLGQYKICAYDYEETNGVLDLFTNIFKFGETSELLQNNQLDNACSKIFRFIDASIKGKMSEFYKEKRSDIVELADLIKSEYDSNKIKLVRYFIITNGRIREDYDWDVTTITEKEIEIEFHIWDLASVYRAEESGRELTDTPIPLNKPIECLKVEENNSKVTTYLGIMPAIELARIYGLHKSKLIEKNVRNFLGIKGINKGILATLVNEPDLFLAYNNGISTVATEVSIERSFSQEQDNPKLLITQMRNWHIVNGGQTTCTIYNAFKKKVDISKAFVAIKICVIKENDPNSLLIPNIAKYANSQTKINESDLNANQRYLMDLDRISKLERTPKEAKHNKETYWYFERLRGQLLSERMNVGETRSKKVQRFLEERPKAQRINKTDIAKVMMAWDGYPYEASKGSELCFNSFWNADYKNTEVTREYFHDLIAKRILFLKINDLFKEGGYKGYGNIVCCYVLSIIALKTQQKLNLEYIWQKQEVQPELIEAIKESISVVVNYITSVAQDGINPTVVAKKADFWYSVKSLASGIKFPTCESVISKSSDRLSPEEAAQIEAAKNVSIETWESLSRWGKTTHKLSIMEKKRIDRIALTLAKAPASLTYQLADGCLTILRMAKDAGFTE